MTSSLKLLPNFFHNTKVMTLFYNSFPSFEYILYCSIDGGGDGGGGVYVHV
jgi:hypothetical protein